MAPETLWKLDATAQAALVRAGEVTPDDLLERAIARIEALNPAVNAVITPLYDEARAQTRAGLPDGQFAGVPLLLKDATLEVEGTPYSIGTRVLRDLGYRSRRTTEMARRLRDAGFVFVAKTNVPELSAGITTEPPAFGPTRNPWDLTRSAGGSSGGSAAAVACGMTSIAHGGDGTGSLRYPAACCGVVTLKPTRGRLPHATPLQPDFTGVWVDFVLARSVRDLAGVLDATAGADAGASHVAPPPVRPYVEEMRGDARKVRIGLLKEDVMANMPVDAECVTAVERAGRLLADLGHGVDEAHPSALDGLFIRTFAAISDMGVVLRDAQFRALETIVGRELTADDVAEPRPAQDAVAKVSGARLVDAMQLIEREMRLIHDWWTSGYDVLVTPTLRQPPWPLGSNKGALDAGVFPPPFSWTGQPAMSLPLHWTADGLPVGVQLVGAYGREDVLFRVAAQLDEAAPWAQRWPEIAVA